MKTLHYKKIKIEGYGGKLFLSFFNDDDFHTIKGHLGIYYIDKSLTDLKIFPELELLI